MFVDDEDRLARMIADCERIRELLRESDKQAEQTRQQPAEIDHQQLPDNPAHADAAKGE